MKKIFLSLMFILSLTNIAHAIDQASLNQLKQQGFVVKMGELTGAGSRMSLGQLAGFIHPRGIVMKADCDTIAVSQSSNQADLKISDVTKVTVDQSVINASEFEGFFINQ